MEVDITEEEQSTPGRGGGGGGGGASPTSNLLSSNAYASGVSQNSGNFLTEKPITRIHAPPGGRSTISFGDYSETTPSKAAAGSPVAIAQQAAAGGINATPTQPTTPESSSPEAGAGVDAGGPAPIPMMELPAVPTVEAEEAVEPPAAPVPGEVVSANAYASGSNQNSGNFMTGRPTTRVRAPPGGASSITFG